MNKIAFITGATSGIGTASAKLFAEHNYDVVICGRRAERLADLEKEIKDAFDVEVISLAFDVRNQPEVEKTIAGLPDRWKKIDLLLNNAGLSAGLNPIQDGDLVHWENMIDTNIKGLLYVSREIMPLMINQGFGHIINIGSLAGKEVYPKGNVYCASKHAVDAINQSMRIDLLLHGIKVSLVMPGATETEFSVVRFDGDEDKAKNAYKGFQALSAEDVADCIYYAASRKPHINVNEILLMPVAQANLANLKKD